MFGERCTLCGGKLDSRKVCTECGLNNSKSEKNYKVNSSSCDGMPMTHVHGKDACQSPRESTEQKTYQSGKAPTVKTYQKADSLPGSYRQKERIPKQKSMTAKPGRKQKKAGWAAKFTTAFVILSIAGTVIGSLAEEIDMDLPFWPEEENVELDPYELLEESGEELPKEGEHAEFELTSGKYIVGVHIPAGNYSAAMSYEYDSIQVNDREHAIFLYEYPAKEGVDYRDDLWLFEGALIEITAEESVILETENAQSIQNEENPLTQSYEFEGETEKIAGVDFEPGVYDIYVNEGYGMVGIGINNDEEAGEKLEEDYEENDYTTENLYVGNGSAKGAGYRNVIIPKGAKLTVEKESYDDEGFKITLTPSPQIASTDYLQTYRDYY